MTALHLDELFLSIQGEGAELGRPHLFLRLGGCPLRCRYCDTPRSWTRRPVFERHDASGTVERPNPVDAAALDAELAAVCAGHGLAPGAVTLAVTGGEPLEQAAFLRAWLPSWPGRVLLETAGVLPEALESLLPHVDHLSLDAKIPATLARGAELLATERCLRAARAAGTDTWVKVVVTAAQDDAAVRATLAAVAAAWPGVRASLQPVTPLRRGPAAPAAETLTRWLLDARDLALDLRVVPQTHPLLGAR